MCVLDLIENSTPCSAQELDKIAAFWENEYQQEYPDNINAYISQDWWEFLYFETLVKYKIPNFCGSDAARFLGVPVREIRSSNPPSPHCTDSLPHNVHADETIEPG